MARCLKILTRWALTALLGLAPIAALAQPPKPAYVTGTMTTGHCVTVAGPQLVQDNGACPSAANPTATASDTAVNGSATTYMRSDAAPAIQKGSSSAFGVVKVDGTSITASGGVITAPPGGAVASAFVGTFQSTSSTSYTDLATAGPSVTMTTGTSVLIILSAVGNKSSGGGNTAFMGIAVSGATTLSPSDATAAQASPPAGGFGFALGGNVVVLTGLTAGSNTFTAKYRVDGSTIGFTNRGLTVFRLN